MIPPTILIAGVGFGLGTLWPRKTRMIMLGILIVWILFFTMGNLLRIDPTGMNVLGILIPRLIQSANTNLASIPTGQRAVWIQQLQATLPDLRGWMLSQSILAFSGILFVVAAAAGFRRFQNELD